MTQDRLLIGVEGSPECRRGMLIKHSLSISNSAILNFGALKCLMWPFTAIPGTVVMQFSHLFLHRTIDFCSAPIYMEPV